MILIPASYGELIDKITILEIKKARLTSSEKIHHVEEELKALCRVRDEAFGACDETASLTEELMRINEMLWEIEDAIRKCEAEANFGPTFVELARAVYKHNDRRSVLKRRINELLNSDIVEEKSYAAYE
jgi:hypothetical protein